MVLLIVRAVLLQEVFIMGDDLYGAGLILGELVELGVCFGALVEEREGGSIREYPFWCYGPYTYVLIHLHVYICWYVPYLYVGYACICTSAILGVCIPIPSYVGSRYVLTLGMYPPNN